MSGKALLTDPHRPGAAASPGWRACASFPRRHAPQPMPTGQDPPQRWRGHAARSFVLLLPTAQRPLAHAAQMVVVACNIGAIWLDARQVCRRLRRKVAHAPSQSRHRFIDELDIDRSYFARFSAAAEAKIQKLGDLALAEIAETAIAYYGAFEQQLGRKEGADL